MARSGTPRELAGETPTLHRLQTHFVVHELALLASVPKNRLGAKKISKFLRILMLALTSKSGNVLLLRRLPPSLNQIW